MRVKSWQSTDADTDAARLIIITTPGGYYHDNGEI